MKRRSSAMNPEEYNKLKCQAAGRLVERNIEPGGIQLVNPFAVAKHESTDLVELAKEIQTADVLVKATACSKLHMIAEQVRFLQQQAHKVLVEAKQNSDLHHVSCNFRKIPGHTYHLYERPNGQKYFSMLSPEEWCSGHSGPPHHYNGAYRLEKDFTWTPKESIVVRSDQLTLMNKLFNNDTLGRYSELEQKTFDVDMN